MIEALERNDVRYVAVGSYAAIAQGVDLDITDLDIVPATDPENRARLVAALKELRAREKVGDGSEPVYELADDPSALTDTTFREFTTDFGKLDVVLRPAGFPGGYEDLVEHVVVVRLQDETDPGRSVEVVMATKEAIYQSKRLAGRQKDVDSLPRFDGIHPRDLKKTVRERYLAEQARRTRGAGSNPDF